MKDNVFIKLSVKKEHLSEGKRKSVHHCPVALASKDDFQKETGKKVHRVSVFPWEGDHSIYLLTCDEEIWKSVYTSSTDIPEFVYQFDNGHFQVYPKDFGIISFVLVEKEGEPIKENSYAYLL